MADGSFFSIDTVSLLVGLPATKALVGTAFFMRGLVKFADGVRKFHAEGPVPYNKASNMGAAMFCALNVAVALFLATLFVGAIAEFLSLTEATKPYADAYAPIIVAMALVEICLLAYVYRGLWGSIEKNGNGLRLVARLRQFREKGSAYHDYVSKRGMSIHELSLLPLGAAGFVTASFWLPLLQ